MAKSKKTKLKEFMESIHYRDICYLIDHMSNQDVLNSCAEDIGYSIGLDFITKDNKPQIKDVIIGKNNEFRVVTFLRKNRPIVECIICNF